MKFSPVDGGSDTCQHKNCPNNASWRVETGTPDVREVTWLCNSHKQEFARKRLKEMPLTHDQFVAYVDSLQVGERVVETTPRNMMTGIQGEVYISDNPGPAFGTKCVMWDAEKGSKRMGTAVTHGTRRVSDVY